MKAVVLVSGGIDSAVALALALEKGRECLAISFDYSQRHRAELGHAKRIAQYFGVFHKIILLDKSAFGNSSLVDGSDVAKDRELGEIAAKGIPNTYVPARNTLFLAFAAAQAELFDAKEIYAGPNLLDQNPYPDCRPAFYQAFQEVLNLATKQAVEGRPPKLITPLIAMDKIGIVREAKRLKVPLEMTFSCYDPSPEGNACARCDACRIREDAIRKA